MYKFLTILALIVCSCTCIDNTVPDAAIDVQPMYQVIQKDNWNITLPLTWAEQNVDNSAQLVAVKDKTLLTFYRQSYEGSFDEFAVMSIRSIRTNSDNISETKSLTINNNPYVFVQSESKDISEITLLTVKDGFSYSLSCGGKDNLDDCQVVYNTLEIN